MGTQKKGKDRGAVRTCILSPTRIVLVIDIKFCEPYWKLPGGRIEPEDMHIVAAAIRECREETGIHLFLGEISLHSKHQRQDEIYRPYLCIAKVTKSRLDTRLEISKENNGSILIKAFERSDVLKIASLLNSHRILIEEVFKSLVT